MKHRVFILMVFVLSCVTAYACPVCDKQQPELLQGITHGTGPQSNWDYLIISVTAIIVVLTLILSIKMLVKPGEQSSDHIKRLILKHK